MNSLHETNIALFKTLKELHLPIGKFVVFGSGAMLARDLSEGRDLDVLVTDELFQEYRNKPKWKIKKTELDVYLCKDSIELWNIWRPGTWDIRELINNAEMIDDIPFVSLETTLRWKKMRGSEKDLMHALVIESYLKKNTTTQRGRNTSSL